MAWETDEFEWQDPDAWRGGEPINQGDEWRERFPGETAMGHDYWLLRRDADDDGCA